MKSQTKKVMRMVRFVEEMKLQRYPNAERFCESLRKSDERNDEFLAVSTKTISREVKHLKDYYKAPVYYDSSERGFYLADLSWQFPYLEMEGEELFASLMAMKLSNDRMPTPLLPSLQNAESIQLAASTPDEYSADTLNSLILATTKMPPITEEIFASILDAWRNERQLKICYKGINEEDSKERVIDIHALFLSHGAWYAYSYCHSRKANRSFALHRIDFAELQEGKFQRNEEIVQTVQKGLVFSYKVVKDVVVECSPKVANIISEREWFKSQENRVFEDGRLQVTFLEIQEDELISWVLSYGGELAIKSPESVKRNLIENTNNLLEVHRG